MKKPTLRTHSGEISPAVMLLLLVALAGGAYWYYQKSSATAADESSSNAPPPPAVTEVAPEFSSPAEAQREAVRRYPELGIAGSRLNRAFVARHKLYQQQRPDFFRDSSWPLLLADELVKTVPAAGPAPKINEEAASASPPKPKAGDWMWEKHKLDPKSKLE